jgi:biopolymer transport protein ExbD
MGGSVGNEDGDLGFQIAPMVDVVFVLLLFFMAIAGQQVVEKRLTINLPSGNTSSSNVVTAPLIIDITPDGTVTMNDANYGNGSDKNLQALREKLKSLEDPVEGKIKDPVIVRPANDTRQERVIDVLNACAAAKVTNLTFG